MFQKYLHIHSFYFALNKLSLFHFDIFIVYVSYSYSADVAFNWSKSQVFQYIKNQLFKEMFFALKNLIVLSTVRYKTFLAKNDAHKCFNM